MTRYRFFNGEEQNHDYFASFGIYTALGWKEAVTFATGYLRGMEQAYESLGQRVAE